ncbi:MAG: pyridoxal 5'-phosphate synthase [Bacteroidota bacterium]
MTVFQKFTDWWTEERGLSKAKLPDACAFSTIDINGFPNARYVSLKAVTHDGFLVTGPTNSRKGQEIKTDPKAALTFWWPETERQVRIQGKASFISNELANTYFTNRNRAAQIVSTTFEQGQPIENLDLLKSKFYQQEQELGDEIPMPKDWGGFLIQPIIIEFMQFKATRLHERELYKLVEGSWRSTWLQP